MFIQGVAKVWFQGDQTKTCVPSKPAQNLAYEVFDKSFKPDFSTKTYQTPQKPGLSTLKLTKLNET
jgi:hypothetical protein